MPQLPKVLYVEALALVPVRKSGIGTCLEQTLLALSRNQELRSWRIELLAPLGKARYLRPYATAPNMHVRTIWLPARVLELLMRLRLLPPVDWFLGRGVYLFPNYRNWPLWRSRSLTYVYDVSFIAHPETGQVKNQRYLSRYIRLWTGRADIVVTISSAMKSQIERLLDVHYAKTAVVPCGVDAKKFFPVKTKVIDETKRRYAIPYERYLLYVGNIEPRKNLLRLLDAYDQLPAALKNSYGLVFVGGGGWLSQDFYERLQSLQAMDAKVMKVDQFVVTDDLPALYSGAGLVVHPAIYEGFGMTPLEAMACATDVAVSDIAVMHEVVGPAGFYFDPADSRSIAATIAVALEKDTSHQNHSAAAKQQVQHFSWIRSAAELTSLIMTQQSLGSHRHPLLGRWANLYRRIDGRLLNLFGEGHHPPYRPDSGLDDPALLAQIYKDFLNEQPRRWQLVGRYLYLGGRHVLALMVKRLFIRRARRGPA